MLNIVERNNSGNQTYIDCAMGLLRYFEMGGFYIREDKKYGYYVKAIFKKDAKDEKLRKIRERIRDLEKDFE